MTMNSTMRKSLTLAVLLSLPACALLGVEPDEIDVLEGADEESLSGNSDASETSSGSEGDSDTQNGDGDPAGDGDGDAGGDGDGDPTTGGDGDGDPAPGDGDGDDSGDGDGDTGTETGPDDQPCEDLVEAQLELGDNPVAVVMGASIIDGDCGSAGPETVYAFTATVDGSHGFSLSSPDFEGALYVGGGSCVPLAQFVCDLEDIEIDLDLLADETIYLIVDADVPGAGTVSITAP